jgi:hypothetical protein
LIDPAARSARLLVRERVAALRGANSITEGENVPALVTGARGAEFCAVRVRFATPSAARHWGGLH